MRSLSPTPAFPHTTHSLWHPPLFFSTPNEILFSRFTCTTAFLLILLVVCGADNNSLDELEPHGILPRLRILRLSANRLKCLDASHFPSLRTLYIDNNSLTEIKKANRLVKLENLSLRNQGGSGL